VRLFVDRARSRRPKFTLTEGNAPLVAEVCRGLDGLPLAIELAAARAAVLSVDQVAARLTDRFRLLRSARDRPTVPARQQAMSTAIDWSYDLLTEPERRLFARLAIFPGSFDLDVPCAPCSRSARPPRRPIPGRGRGGAG
jgi:predicted ATPase